MMKPNKKILCGIFACIILLFAVCNSSVDDEFVYNIVQTQSEIPLPSEPVSEATVQPSAEIPSPAPVQTEPTAEPTPNPDTVWKTTPAEHTAQSNQSTPEPTAEQPEYTCSLTVRCDTLIDNPKLKAEKKDFVPKDGIIFSEQNLAFNDGESAFDILLRKMHENNIPFEFSKTPAYNSIYIEGINNLYEFDAGETSGWLYRINNTMPNHASSEYKVQNNDNIEFIYTCKFGKDI